MSPADDDLHPDVAAALDEVLGGDDVVRELGEKLRTVIVNCLASNFADSDVRAVIDKAATLSQDDSDAA